MLKRTIRGSDVKALEAPTAKRYVAKAKLNAPNSCVLPLLATATPRPRFVMLDRA